MCEFFQCYWKCEWVYIIYGGGGEKTIIFNRPVSECVCFKDIILGNEKVYIWVYIIKCINKIYNYE